MTEKSKKMTLIADSLAKVDPDVNRGIWDMAQNLSEQEIICFFNQTALDFFTFAINITKKMGKEREYGFSGYMMLFETTLKMNKSVPVDQFTILILEFAPDIYNANEKFFLDMYIPDGKIGKGNNNGNEFNIIQSQEFKKLWLALDSADKENIKERIIVLTTYAHAYFYKLLMSKTN